MDHYTVLHFGVRECFDKKSQYRKIPVLDFHRHWKDHFKSDLRSDQDHRLKKDLRSDQDQIFFK
jgi:hypothetical protein